MKPLIRESGVFNAVDGLDPQIESGYHSAIQESALVISLQMFNLIINRCIQLLREQLQRMKSHPDQIDWHYPLVVSADAQILLPAIKVSYVRNAILKTRVIILIITSSCFFFSVVV